MPNISMTRRCSFHALIALMPAFVSSAATTQAQGATSTVALSGQSAPGAGAGTFNTFGVPVMNDSATTAFNATVSGGSANSGVFSGSGGTVSKVALNGQFMPFIGTFSWFYAPMLNDSGTTMFFAELNGVSRGLFGFTDGSISHAVLPGSAAPGTDGGTFSVFRDFALNDSGAVAFGADVTGSGSGSESGLFKKSASSLNLTAAALDGQSVPGPSSGWFGINSFTENRVALNDSGTAAFIASFTDPAIRSGIFKSSGSSLTAVALEGQIAPGTGGVFRFFGGVELNNRGAVALHAFNANTSLQGVYVRLPDGSSAANVTEGQSAPGTGGGTFAGFGHPALNDSDAMAFRGYLAGGGAGIFRKTLGISLTALALTGQTAPGMGGGTFSDFEDDPDLNESGTVAFRAKIAGGTGNQGLFLADSLEVIPVAVAGQSLEGTAIATLNFKGGNDFEGRGRAFNQYGQVAYQAALANGSSGIFVYTPTLRYRSTTSGSWDDNSNWTVGLKPGAPHDILIDAAGSVTVSGPSVGAVVNSLQIGGGAGVATLALRGGAPLSAAGGTTIAATGVLTGDGALEGNVTNHGSVVAQNVRVLGGTLTNEGLIGGHGILNAAINNSTLGEVRAHAGERLRLTGPSFDNFGSVQAIGGAAAPAELEFTNSVTNATGAGVILGSDSLFRFRSGLSNQSSFALSMGSNSVFSDIDNTADGTIVVSGGASAAFYGDIVQSGAFRVSKVGSTTSVAVIYGEFTGAGGTTGGGDIFLKGI